ncbi:2,3-bisphosphoglycerate-independent phosphoglycerate mutase [Coraliomargarita sp. SDUM461003]|uniref:2,3-bisphosphoglycerate-independent phosphoglycerate mutase n=1 Tax=Thalassobacterium maritimum TaxID=3041265 RepID=A0ABU1ARC7_9BACT|nr:2,3-bisphosphoglycerate-independent phosphoglycerate mutase [Coraliomargarita sp. SDUM461003]MDQ8206714.1 2,3-bisphosphoglycerate-independent phosphoglycerate mutase [Coraliomargarita sp. SDUM461003]
MSEKQKPVVLIIRDGWGANHDASYDAYNAVKLANTPVADRLTAEYPRTEIAACGLEVGLPAGIMGNSEVGHQNIGAGRVVDQELVRINKGIETGSVKESPALKAAFDNVRAKGSALHFMGLVSDAGVHSMLDHLYGLLKIAKEEGIERVYLHAFTDGRDTGPFSGKNFIAEVEAQMTEIGVGQIASIAGRYWAMDRDNRWDRVQRAYDCITGRTVERSATSADAAIQLQYDSPETEGTKGDEFCPPTAIVGADGQAIAAVQEGDSVIFFNFRGDRPRELTRAFIQDDFDGFDRGEKLDVFFATLSEYQKGLCPNIVFQKPEKMKDILGSYVADKGIGQFRCAETEKFPHVTFFFNDYREEPFPGEDRELVPSRKDCATYDEKPEMSAYGIRDASVEAIKSGKYGLVVINFANPDMVGHTGVLDACIQACEIVDGCVGDLLAAIDEVGGSAVITADHGNSDQLWNHASNGPHTAHTLNPVEVVVYSEQYKNAELMESGALGDIAPTLLKLMNLPQPESMTGHCLIK